MLEHLHQCSSTALERGPRRNAWPPRAFRALDADPVPGPYDVFHVLHRPFFPTLSAVNAEQTQAAAEFAEWLQLPKALCGRLALHADSLRLRAAPPLFDTVDIDAALSPAALRSMWTSALSSRSNWLLERVFFSLVGVAPRLSVKDCSAWPHSTASTTPRIGGC